LKGEFRILFLYEVAEAIRLDVLRPLLEPGGVQPSIGLTPPIPHYLHFERSPVVEAIRPMVLKAGEHIEGKTNYYDYGVVSIELELPFDCDWGALVQQASQWIGATELESRAMELLRTALKHASPALVKTYDTWLKEDYYVIQLREIRGADGHNLASEELLALHGPEIAQLVRGESALLSDAERQEVLQSSISYSHADLLVVGWGGALVYGSSEVAATTIQLLEYANSQLLEFRYYDTLLTSLLDGVYRSLERQGGLLTAWRLSREAARLNTLRLDVRELTERIDTSIKFLSDMFSARQYRMAAVKIGVDDYRRLVDSKLNTAGDLYTFMMDQFHASRGFVLELMVVVILVIELVFVFRGKP